jgi:tetratricopeptide (TPR) repeat protein
MDMPEPAVAETFNLALAHLHAGNTREAERLYRLALDIYPDFADAQSNLGNILRDRHELEEAKACYAKALSLEPHRADIHCNRAIACFRSGDYATAFADYEWRFVLKTGTTLFNDLTWDGSPLAGGTILLHAEQGLGDTLQMIRYAPLVQERGGRVSVRVQPSLISLLSGFPGIEQVLSNVAPVDEFDFNASLLSLPAIFRTTVETVPASVPYLTADPSLVEKWRKILANIDGFKVGICWQGAREYPDDSYRSFPLASFAPLAEVPGVQLISLQKGHGTEQRAGAPFEVVDLGDDVDASDAFTDTAAIMQNLDLLISADTAPAHLAGALGRSVWVPLPVVHDWRWIPGRDDSPWYPTMRLFRQETSGEWYEVFQRMAAALAELVAARGA